MYTSCFPLEDCVWPVHPDSSWAHVRKRNMLMGRDKSPGTKCKHSFFQLLHRFPISYCQFSAVEKGLKTRICSCSQKASEVPHLLQMFLGSKGAITTYPKNTGTIGLFASNFSPVCVFMCSSKYCFMLKSLPHHWHMNCLCPMWMLMWERSWYLYWNRSSQFYSRDNRGVQMTCTHQVNTQGCTQKH